MRLLKKNIMLRILNSYLVDSPQPANISYLWNFGSLLGTCLMLQILTGVFLAMHYQPHVDYAFLSVEHPVWILHIFLILIYSYFLFYLILSSKLLFLSPAWVAMPVINKEANLLKFFPYHAEPEIEIRSQFIDKNNPSLLHLNFLKNLNNTEHSSVKLVPSDKDLLLSQENSSNITFNLKDENINFNLLNNIKQEEFIEWFRGFTDGEGCFLVTPTVKKDTDGKITSMFFTFSFVICLHRDDMPMLTHIKEILGMGNVNISGRFATFTISKLSDIKKIIYLFSKNPLNTSKHLNFLGFKKAYEIYNKLDSETLSFFNEEDFRLKIYEEILLIKNSMNRKRTSFELVNHSIKITPYWLLGFVEGEGSFNVSKSKDFSLEFGVCQTLSEKKVMLEIQRFLLELPGEYPIRRKNSTIVPLYEDKKAKNENSNPMLKIQIRDLNYIGNVLIPFFNSLIWKSKKRLDYLDWKAIFNLKREGKLYLPECKELILAICNRMNLKRLSTNNTNLKNISGCAAITNDLDLKLKSLLEAPSNLELHSNGKIFIKSSGEYIRGRGNITVEVFLKEEEGRSILINSFESIRDCAKFFKVDPRTIIRRLDSGEVHNYENKTYLLKRKTSEYLFYKF